MGQKDRNVKSKQGKKSKKTCTGTIIPGENAAPGRQPGGPIAYVVRRPGGATVFPAR